MKKRSGMRTAAILGFVALTLSAATGLCWYLRTTADPPPAPASASKLEMPPDLFRDWGKPEVALVLSGEQHGYLFPCGCSPKQVGGLERRWNLLQLLRDRKWPVAAVDLGDLPQRHGPHRLPNLQGLVKYRYSMEALKKMGYLAVGLGENEAALSLAPLLGEFALNNNTPAVLSANLNNKEELYPEEVFSTVVKTVPGSDLRIGIAGIIDPSMADKVKPFKVLLDDRDKATTDALDAMTKQKADLRVMLCYAGTTEAKAFAAKHGAFHVVLCLSPESEPTSEPIKVGSTWVVNVGHKGRYVGVVGVYPTGKADKPYEFRYQLVSLTEEFLTPKGEEARQPILKLMNDYAKEVKANDYLSQYGGMKHPSQVAVPGVNPVYVGSQKCRKCHESAYEVWEKSKHSHAFDSLVNAQRPPLRQFDGECVVCHVVGFGYESGYRNEKDTPKLKNVGCESCHGPAGAHVDKPTDQRWYPILNPWRPGENETPRDKERRQLRIDIFCQTCHDIDNDVHYKFDKRWPDVAHPSGE